jgi:hypothetical protein
MKYSHWASWLIIGGLAMDLIDAVTAPAAGQPGAIYGGPLASLSGKLPYSISIGELLIAVGVGYHLVKGQSV